MRLAYNIKITQECSVVPNNKELAYHLHDLLDDAIKKKLKEEGVRVCAKELARVRGTLNQMSGKSFSASREQFFLKRIQDTTLDVIQTLKNVINEVDHVGHSLEIEMHGVQNYSEDETNKLQRYAYKVELQKTLEKMLKAIYKEYPSLSDKESARSVILYLRQPVPFKR